MRRIEMSYDMIDRFLRNNLGDDNYAEYSAALDSLCTPQRKPLTDEQREEIAKGWRGRNWTVGDIIDATEAAHGIKENT
jgi:hypothetical protein